MSINIPSLEISQRPRVAFVQACWHREIVDQLRESFTQEFGQLSDRQIDYFELPGAFEIPLFAKNLAATGKYAAVVAAALVVNGGIYQHEYVASAVIDGLMHAQLETGMPVFSAVLTPHNFHDGAEHQQFFKEHFIIKGREVASACAQTLTALSAVNAEQPV